MKAATLALIAILLYTDTYSDSNKNAKYNSYVNKAELAIIKGMFLDAEEYFDSAFRYNYPRAIDLQNALMVSLETHNRSNFTRYSIALADLGVGKKYFELKKVFTGSKGEPQWKVLMKRADSSKNAIEAKNISVLKKLKLLVQSCDNAENEYAISDRSYESSVKFTKQISNLTKSLSNLFVENGFLSERLIGVSIIRDTIITDPSFTKLLSLTRLAPGSGSLEVAYDEIFLPILQRAIIHDNINPDYVFKTVSSLYCDSFKFPSTFSIDCKIYMRKSISPNLDVIALNRKSIGLCDFEQFVSKVIFKSSSVNSPFEILSEFPAPSSQPLLTQTSEVLERWSIYVGSKKNCK